MTRLVLMGVAICVVKAILAATPPPQKLTFSFEFRMRYENRDGVAFGRDPDNSYPLFRTRVGANYRPASWVRFSGLAQDGRAPLFGGPAPGNLRNTLDLQEGFVELGNETGPGALIGRQMSEFGDTRLIGSPQWVNTARTYDTLQLYHRNPTRTVRAIFLSVVKVRTDSFDIPVLGDRAWGTYNTYHKLIPGGQFEWYVLRHDQNRPGGFVGHPGGRLGINFFGTRVVTPLGSGLKLTVEAIGQTGKVDQTEHRAAGWVSGLARRISLGKPVDFSVEYKYASGTRDPLSGRSGTFDQLYPAAHDKFGHADLIGWRNIHNIRSLETVNMNKSWKINIMYNASWLASPRDALYGTNGRPVAVAPRGDAGRYVGQELDFYTLYRGQHLQLGAGIAKFFAGEFVHNTTPGANTLFFYFFQGVTF